MSCELGQLRYLLIIAQVGLLQHRFVLGPLDFRRDDFLDHILGEAQLAAVGLDEGIALPLIDDPALPLLAILGDERIGAARWPGDQHHHQKAGQEPSELGVYGHPSPSFRYT
ncbi:MAG: hypothetical protein AMJ77_06875, partial [Dehalococcoidia bacterium SM23_28_2]